jgi:predicted nucleic acid-binding protein
MVLVDTSVWISHFRIADVQLIALLKQGNVATHPFIIGEIACGHLKNRDEILNLMQTLPHVLEASHKEILEFLKIQKLMGTGLGLIDIHLLASAHLSGTPLWTKDKTLKTAAHSLSVHFRG